MYETYILLLMCLKMLMIKCQLDNHIKYSIYDREEEQSFTYI